MLELLSAVGAGRTCDIKSLSDELWNLHGSLDCLSTKLHDMNGIISYLQRVIYRYVSADKSFFLREKKEVCFQRTISRT